MEKPMEPMELDVPLERLQSEILVAALLRRPLPSLEHPIGLADLHLLVREDGIVLVLDDQVAPGVVTTVRTELSKGPGDANVRDVRAVSLEEARRARIEGGLAFLRFGRPESTADGIRLALETCGLPDPAGPIHVLGALIVDYVRTDGGWDPAGPPRQLAT